MEALIHAKQITVENLQQDDKKSASSEPNSEEVDHFNQSMQQYKEEHRDEFYETQENTLFLKPQEKVHERRISSNSPYANYDEEQEEIE